MEKRLEAYFPPDVAIRVEKPLVSGFAAIVGLPEAERPTAFAHRVVGDGASNPRFRGAVLLALREHFNDAKLQQLTRDDLIPRWQKQCVEQLFADAVAAHRRLPALRARALRVFEALPPRSWDSCLLWMFDSADSRLLLALAYGPLPPDVPPAGGAADFRRALKLPPSPRVREDDPRVHIWGETFPPQKWSLEDAGAAEAAAATLAPLIDAADARPTSSSGSPSAKADALVKSILALPPRTLSSVYAHVHARWDDDDVYIADAEDGFSGFGASGASAGAGAAGGGSLLAMASAHAAVPSDGLPLWRREAFGRILRLARRELGADGAPELHSRSGHGASAAASGSSGCGRGRGGASGERKGEGGCAGSECTVQ